LLVDAGTRVFWLVLALLFGASLFFWSGVEEERARRLGVPAGEAAP
jgi:hypothetical protein